MSDESKADDISVEEMMRRRREAQDLETQKVCPWCRGNGMAPASKVDSWRATYPEVADKEPVIP